MSTTSSERPPIPDPTPAVQPAGADDPRTRGLVAVDGGLPWLPKTLRGQVVLPIVLVVLLAVVAFAVTVLHSTRDDAGRRLDAALSADGRLVAALAAERLPLGSGVSPAGAQAFASDIAAALGDQVTIIAPDGTVLGDSLVDPAIALNLRLNPGVSGVASGVFSLSDGEATPGGEAFRYASVRLPDSAVGVRSVTVRVGVPLDGLREDFAAVRFRIVVVALIVLVVVMSITVLTVDRVSRGIALARDHAGRIAAGRIEPDTRPSPIEELGELRSSFNGMVFDLSDLVAEIRRSRAELESILSTLTDGAIVTRADGTIVRLNPAAARLLAVRPDDVIGEPFVTATRDHELGGLLRESLRTGTVTRGERIEFGLDRRSIDALIQPVVGEDNDLTLVLLRDQTELRRLEQIRREFVANVSHELRTPLASIRALVETLEAGAVDEPELAADFFGRIVTEVDRLAGLVDELLDLARLESGRVTMRFEPVAPADLLRRGAERLLPQVQRARLDLIVDVSPDLPPVLADRNRIEQVLLNLIHNAIKFTPPGGSITVTADVRADMLRVHVRDTGVGIQPDELPRLFERFYKADKARRSDGTGLGLAIAKHIVISHGGTITARSTVDRGATFLFTLPLADRSTGPIRRDADVPAPMMA